MNVRQKTRATGLTSLKTFGCMVQRVFPHIVPTVLVIAPCGRSCNVLIPVIGRTKCQHSRPWPYWLSSVLS